MLKALRTSKTSLSSSSRFVSSSLPSIIRVPCDRSYATEAALPSTSAANAVSSGRDPEGPLRPHLGVEVNPNHGLWAFFRKTVGKDGVESYETLEKKDSAVDYSGAPSSLFSLCSLGVGLWLSVPVACAELRLPCSVRSFGCRSCVEGRGTSKKELQGPSYAMVRGPEGEELVGDATLGVETAGGLNGPHVYKPAHV